MSIKLDKTKLGPKFDRRIKLTDIQRAEIKASDLSSRQLAKTYGVSRRLITFIQDPEKAKRAKELYEIRSAGGRYYDRKRNTKAVKDTRGYKRNLINSGKLKYDTE